MAFRLKRGEPLEHGLRRIAREELDGARGRLASSGINRDRAIHDCRRGFKRMRALLRLAQPALAASFEAENRRWRDAGRMLSRHRDAAVLLDVFDSTTRRLRNRLSTSARASIRRGLAEQIGHDLDEARVRRAVEAVIAIVDDATPGIGALSWPHTAEEVSEGFRGSQARVRREWRRAVERDDETHLHDWRKRLKDRTAQLEIVWPFLDVDHKQLIANGKKLADMLGGEHDLAVLAARMNAIPDLGPADALGSIGASIERQRAKLRAQAFRLAPAVCSRKPRAFAQELGGRIDRGS